MKPWVMGVLLAVMLLSGCSNTGIPEGLEPVENLDVQRYLGQWHEIVRLDHGFDTNAFIYPKTRTNSL